MHSLAYSSMSNKLVFFVERQSSPGETINFSEATTSRPASADQGAEHRAPIYPFISQQNRVEIEHMNTLNGKNEKQETQRIRVLHIEDDEELRFLVRIFLKDIADLDAVDSAEKALEILPQSNYHLILTDIDLGSGLNGIEATRLIRSMEEYRNIPVVAATAYGSDSIRNQCRDAGMHAILLKPFLKKDLLHIIEQVVHHENE